MWNEMRALSGERQLLRQVCIKMWALSQEVELGRPVIDEKWSFLKKVSFQGSFMVFHVLLLVFMVLKGSYVVFVWFSYFVRGIFWLVVLGFHAWMTNYLSISSYLAKIVADWLCVHSKRWARSKNPFKRLSAWSEQLIWRRKWKRKNGKIVFEQKYPAIQAESELGSWFWNIALSYANPLHGITFCFFLSSF